MKSAIISMISAALLLTAELWLCCIPQAARTLMAELEGTVTELNGKPLGWVAVNFRDLKRNLQGGLLTPATGRYHISYYPGPYLIEAKLRGFKRWVRKEIILKDNETQQLDIVFVAGGSAAVVNLRPEGYIQRALESVRRSTGFSGRERILRGFHRRSEFLRTHHSPFKAAGKSFAKDSAVAGYQDRQ